MDPADDRERQADLEVRIDVAASPDAVWAVLADLDRLEDWLTVHDGFRSAPDRLEEGAEMEQAVSSGPVGATVQWRLTTVRPGRALVWEGMATGGAEVRTSYELTPTDDGTRIDCATDFTLPGGPLGAVAARIAEPRGRQEATRSLERLRDLVEHD